MNIQYTSHNIYCYFVSKDAPNDIQPEIVASDMLGLIAQDVTGRHLTLLTSLLDFMAYVRKYSTHSELTESDIHIIMLPVFFNLQVDRCYIILIPLICYIICNLTARITVACLWIFRYRLIITGRY